MDGHRIVTREAWLEERIALLAQEKALTRARDALARQRRALPWVRVEKDYVFDSPHGPARLAELFEGRSQLSVYHFMLAPDDHHICNGCAFLADHVDAARRHFEHADLSFVAVSRAPLAQIEAVRRRMGWRFAWVSSAGTSFNHDYGVSFTAAEVAERRTGYNYGTTDYAAPDLPGTSIFARDPSGAVFHTYSCYTRGGELLLGALNWLDLTPEGRNEVGGIMSWVRLHDEYPAEDGAEAAPSCCGGEG
jgi:predicted dithiol-disulfide oxidoreductase (DUF899 family)